MARIPQPEMEEGVMAEVYSQELWYLYVVLALAKEEVWELMYKKMVMQMLEAAAMVHLKGILGRLALQLVHSLLPLVLLSLDVLVVGGFEYLKLDFVLSPGYFVATGLPSQNQHRLLHYRC